MEFLRDLARRASGVRLLVISRSESDILGFFSQNPDWLSVAVDTAAISKDVKRLVEDELDKHSTLKALPEAIRGLILKRLAGADNFQYVTIRF